jgi:hypothetical protein
MYANRRRGHPPVTDDSVMRDTTMEMHDLRVSILRAGTSRMRLLHVVNDIIKLIIDLIPVKHNMSKNLYRSRKIMVGLSMNYEKIDVCEKIHVVLEGAHG